MRTTEQLRRIGIEDVDAFLAVVEREVAGALPEGACSDDIAVYLVMPGPSGDRAPYVQIRAVWPIDDEKLEHLEQELYPRVDFETAWVDEGCL